MTIWAPFQTAVVACAHIKTMDVRVDFFIVFSNCLIVLCYGSEQQGYRCL